jgi:hypothetical protein
MDETIESIQAASRGRAVLARTLTTPPRTPDPRRGRFLSLGVGDPTQRLRPEAPPETGGDQAGVKRVTGLGHGGESMAPDPDEVHLFRCRRTWALRLSLTGLPRPISSREPRKPPRVAMSMHPNREAERPRRVAESPRRGRCPCGGRRSPTFCGPAFLLTSGRCAPLVRGCRRRPREPLSSCIRRRATEAPTQSPPWRPRRTSDPGATAEVAVCAHQGGPRAH